MIEHPSTQSFSTQLILSVSPQTLLYDGNDPQWIALWRSLSMSVDIYDDDRKKKAQRTFAILQVILPKN